MFRNEVADIFGTRCARFHERAHGGAFGNAVFAVALLALVGLFGVIGECLTLQSGLDVGLVDLVGLTINQMGILVLAVLTGHLFGPRGTSGRSREPTNCRPVLER